MLCPKGLKKAPKVDQREGGQSKKRKIRQKANRKTVSPTHCKVSSVAVGHAVLGRGAKKKPTRYSAISINQCPNQPRPSYGGMQAKSQKVARHFMPNRGASSCDFNVTQIIKAHKNPMGAPKPVNNYRQPAGNQVRGYHTVRIHFNRSPIEPPLPLLPTAKSQKHRP